MAERLYDLLRYLLRRLPHCFRGGSGGAIPGVTAAPEVSKTPYGTFLAQIEAEIARLMGDIDELEKT